MGGDELGFHNKGSLICPSSDTNTKTMSANGGDPFYASGWDPLVSLSMNQNFGGSSMVSHAEFGSSAYPGMSGTSHIVQYPSDSSFSELVPKLPCFGSAGLSEMVSSFGLSECGQVSTLGCHPNYSPNKKAGNERTSMIGGRPEEDSKEGGSVSASPDGKKRKRTIESNSPFNPNKNVEEEMQKDLSGESNEGPREEDGKKLKTEESTGANLRAKQSGKQTKDNSNSGDGDYIQVRARRGQATNSHSLAERVRREKISERMRLLQELVPGCTKITGKAVMLDEIINYVQSLQQQVEFLSMKLATVNPELSIDLERILSKDILHFGMSSSQAYPHRVFPGTMQSLPSAALHFPPLPQIALDADFQNLFQMGINPNSAIDNLGPNGRLKSEL